MKSPHCRPSADTLAASIELLEHCIDDKQLIAGRRRRHFLFSGLLFADSGSGRPMMTTDADGGFAGSGRRRW